MCNDNIKLGHTTGHGGKYSQKKGIFVRKIITLASLDINSEYLPFWKADTKVYVDSIVVPGRL